MIYQIFPDRFAIGGGKKPEEKVTPPSDLHGGDLDGIVEHLDHVKDLGAETVYLTPIFSAPSSHRYDARSYRDVDPVLGDVAAFERLAAACRARGLGLVLDAVFNHTGEEHAWLREHREWYTFFADGRHLSWRSYGHLPELRLENEELRHELVTGPESVVRTWLRRGATGWRIDCANDTGVEVCSLVRSVAAQEGARDGVTGEVMAWAAPWLRAGALDGVMNYWFRETVVSVLRREITTELASSCLAEMAREYPLSGLLRSWNVVGSHDTARARSLLGAERAQAAYLLAFTYPGVPFVYYGDEVGMEGGEDPDNRRPMVWDRSKWDEKMLERIRALGALRRELRALREGSYVPFLTEGAIAFARVTDDPTDTVVVVVNPQEKAVELKVFAPRTELFDSIPLVDALSTRETKMRSGAFKLALDAGEGVVLVPKRFEASGYDFMKRVGGL